MLYLQTWHSFEAAHKLPRPYRGPCSEMHGHSYRLRVKWRVTRKLDKVGMSMDFKLVKEKMSEYLSRFDHTILNNSCCKQPTAEMMVAKFAMELTLLSDEEGWSIQPCEIELWETEKCSAIWDQKPF